MKTQDRLMLVFGAVIGVFVMIFGIVGGLYWLTGMDHDGTRWWAVVATLALPVSIIVTYRLATHAAREHLSGFERGVTGAEHTITAIGRGLSATASLARTSRPGASAWAASDNADLLPKVCEMRMITSHQDETSVIDL